MLRTIFIKITFFFHHMSDTLLNYPKQIPDGIETSALILEALTLLSNDLIAFVHIFSILGAGSI